jgi:DNA primase
VTQLSDDLLYHTNIVSLVEKYVSLRKVGRNRSGLCPFHKEKSPSFTVAEDKQIYKCFWCGKGGNAINFLIEIERIDYRDAAKILAKDAHIDLSKYERKRGEQWIPANEEKREDIKSLNKDAEQCFAHQLIGSIGETYLMEHRKLSSKTIAMFGLGYIGENNQFIDAMVAKGHTWPQLVAASLAREQQGGIYTSFFRKRIMFPIWDHIGNVVGFAGRGLTPADMPKYLNISETPLYDKSKLLYGMHIAKTHLKEFWSLIIVEGYMDVIALYDAGLPIGVATCGTALTAQHAKLLKRHTDKITFSFDTDNAGFEATIRGLKVAYEAELYPTILLLPKGYKDIDEYVHSDADYKTFLLDPHSRQDGFLFLINKLLTQYDSKNPVERKKIQHLCFEVLVALQDYSIMMMYIEQLAFKLGTNQDSLFQQFKVYLKQKPVLREQRKEIGEQSLWENKGSVHMLGPIGHFMAFYDDAFSQEFLWWDIYILDMIRKIQDIYTLLELTPVQENVQEAVLWRQHHFGIYEMKIRPTKVQSRIETKLFPAMIKTYTSQNNLSSLITEIKRK